MKVFGSYDLLHDYYVNPNDTLFGWTLGRPKEGAAGNSGGRYLLFPATPSKDSGPLLRPISFQLTLAPISEQTRIKYKGYGDSFKSEWSLKVCDPPTYDLEQTGMSGVSNTASDDTEYFDTLSTLFRTHFIPSALTQYTLSQRGYRGAVPRLSVAKNGIRCAWG